MIIYFSGTGNSLATARKIAEATNVKVKYHLFNMY
jgi:flavodoxin